MSHELTIRKNGMVEAAFAGKKPWHGLGAMVDERMTTREALRVAHLDWDVRLRPLWVRSMENEKAFQIHDKQAVCRVDNGRYLGTVGTQYTPLQNSEQAEFIESLVGEGDVVECVGSLFGGARTFWTIKVPGDLIVAGDKIEQYLILANAHDGSMAFRAFWSPIRVVCNNTLNASLGNASDGISIRHTRSAKMRVKEARKVLGLGTKYYQQLGAAFESFADKRITRTDYNALLDSVFDPEDKADETTRQKTRLINIKGIIAENLRDEAKTLGKTRITLWDAYNGITFYTSHQLTGRAVAASECEKRFTSVMFGNGKRIQQRAFKACIAALN